MFQYKDMKQYVFFLHICHLYHAFICSFILSIHLDTFLHQPWNPLIAAPTVEKTASWLAAYANHVHCGENSACWLVGWCCFVAVWLAGCYSNGTTTIHIPWKRTWFLQSWGNLLANYQIFFFPFKIQNFSKSSLQNFGIKKKKKKKKRKEKLIEVS